MWEAEAVWQWSVGGKGVGVSDSVANVFRVGVIVGSRVKVGETVEGSVEVTTTGVRRLHISLCQREGKASKEKTDGDQSDQYSPHDLPNILHLLFSSDISTWTGISKLNVEPTPASVSTQIRPF